MGVVARSIAPGCHGQRAPRLKAGLAIALAALLVLSLWIGWVPISPAELGGIVRSWLGGTTGDALGSKALVFGLVRIPRALVTVLVGMGLSAAGAVYQGLFRNPLVSPDILGVSAGATFGAALGLIMAGTGWLVIHSLSFVFGLAAVGMALLIARLVAVRPMLVLVLAGLVVLSVFNSSLTLLKYLSDPYNELPAIVFWTMGSMSRAQWHDLRLMAPIIGGSLVMIHVIALQAQRSISGRPPGPFPGAQPHTVPAALYLFQLHHRFRFRSHLWPGVLGGAGHAPHRPHDSGSQS